jgi:serine/threonine protein kinase
LERYLAATEAGEKPNRQAFLARHPDIAGALAECLDGLEALQAASSSGRPSHAAENLDTASVDLQPEAPLGDFRMVREIGRGGMGIVYEAVQMSLGRRVALKVLPFAAALDAKQLQRFKNEAQAAAHLHHTNIVPVYAVGAERGVHFYAMQLIEGQNLAALIADLRGRTGPASSVSSSTPEAVPTGPYPPLPRSAVIPAETRPNLRAQLSTQRSDGSPEFFHGVVRLVAQVAEALDYAHGMGIIHRDVKPANLLVDARGNVWITDFGLAHFHTDAGLTQTGDLVGTLRYMSPEQAGGPRTLIDHRTDVYSLGATLYELLTLRPIFEGTDRNTLLHQILYAEPRAPRLVDRSIPPELETIVLKAVSKVPAERYATARDFAEDLQRFLRHEPILARRATFVQRTRKWLRRHPSVVATAVGMLVLLAAGSLFSAWLIQGERDKALQRAQQAEDRFQLAKRSVDEMIRVSEEELADRPDMEGLRRQLLEFALTYYQQFIDQHLDKPDAQQLTATKDRVKKILDDLIVLQGGGQLFLLKNPDVLEALQASREQQTRLDEVWSRLDKQRDTDLYRLRRSNLQEWTQSLLNLASASEDTERILTDEQRRRLKQLALQRQGAAAFREPKIVEALQLTSDQKERIRAILAMSPMFFGGPDRMGPPGPPPGEPDRMGRPGPPPGNLHRFHDAKLRQTSERILAVLTKEQAKLWQEMIGEPFKGSFCSAPDHAGPGGDPNERRPSHFGPPGGPK